MDLQDDSDQDSDYEPPPEVAEEVDEAQEKKLVGLSRGSKRKVNALWEQMMGEEQLYTQEKMQKSINFNSKQSKKKNKRVRSENEAILASIFGKKEARKLIGGKASSSRADLKEANDIDDATGKVDTGDLKARVKASMKNVQKKTTITETRKFAGQEIEVQRTVLQSAAEGANARSIASSSSSSATTASSSSSGAVGVGGGIDSVLDTIKGPKLVSTVAKSSMDWDVYKEKEGLEEDLAAASKDGYLTRKDFLDRCDVRTYVVDKAERVLTQAGGGGEKK
mmetsp:Transcript_25401/g.42356  ORF Transcript_25401/g.42356 Transcript_25401/m.42356 type:complete len:280 (+) Transcript_25401:37-876(+)